jgi:hypothetical protein
VRDARNLGGGACYAAAVLLPISRCSRCGAARLLQAFNKQRDVLGICGGDVVEMCGMRGCCGCWRCWDVAGDVTGMSEMSGISGQLPPLPLRCLPAKTARTVCSEEDRLHKGITPTSL